MYRTNQILLRRKSLPAIILFFCLLSFAFVACGTNTGAGASSPTPVPTATQGQASTSGCPDNILVTTPPPAANVVLKSSESNTTVSANKGDTIEVDLPFGHLWEGPTSVPSGLLSAQTPSGYAFSTTQICVWRFVAVSSGTVRLNFLGRPICKKGAACPMYILAIPFTIDIK
jgi:hypothetical protein